MAALNKFMAIGRCGSDTETRTARETNVSSFRLAISENYRDRDGEKKEITEWVNIVAFGKTSDFVENYVEKGALLYVEGKLRTRNYEDKSGLKRYVTEVVADTVKILERKQERQDATPKSEPIAKTMQEADKYTDDSDLPF